ncbi:MAG: hypothetical protein O3A01_07335 [bacterium]|nr:hypothetical protein [bacterium]
MSKKDKAKKTKETKALKAGELNPVEFEIPTPKPAKEDTFVGNFGLRVNEFTDEERQNLYDVFKPFIEKSNFEFIAQRWDYDDENIRLNDFLQEFKKKEMTVSFLHHSCAYEQPFRKNHLYQTQHTWKLYNLKKDMFYWDNLGYGIYSLFWHGSGYNLNLCGQTLNKNYGEAPNKLLKKFMATTGLKSGQFNCFSTMTPAKINIQEVIIQPENPEFEPFKNFIIDSQIENIDNWKKYRDIKLKQNTRRLNPWVSEWFQNKRNDRIFIFQDLKQKQLILLTATDFIYE